MAEIEGEQPIASVRLQGAAGDGRNSDQGDEGDDDERLAMGMGVKETDWQSDDT